MNNQLKLKSLQQDRYLPNLLLFLPGALFSNDRPNYMNFGAIGFIIGHEITHGFDDQGRQFDKNGKIITSFTIVLSAL